MDELIIACTSDLKEDYDDLVGLYNKLASVSAIFGENTFRILQMERMNNELSYMNGIHRANNERIKEDVVKMKEAKTEIDTLVNSKVSRAEVIEWINGYIARVNALKNLNPAVYSISFKAMGFE